MAKRQPIPEEEDDSFLEINELELEKEWMKQPDLAATWLKKLARAKRTLDVKRAKKELVEAQLDKKIRQDPEAFELEKVTENAIGTAIILCKEYQDIAKEINEAQFKVNIIQGLCTAIEHRKRALEGMVELFGQQYWSLPNTSSDNGREAMRDLVKKGARSKRKKENDDE